MNKFLKYILSPIKWIKCIKEIIDLDQKKMKKRKGWIPILNNLGAYIDFWNDTIGKGKGFDSFYNKTKDWLIYWINYKSDYIPPYKIDF